MNLDSKTQKIEEEEEEVSTHWGRNEAVAEHEEDKTIEYIFLYSFGMAPPLISEMNLNLVLSSSTGTEERICFMWEG